MVVAQVVRIRNNTMRTFRITSVDWFYTPTTNGQPWPDSSLRITPGYDEACEGVFIPWEALTLDGLEVREDVASGDGKCVKFVVGPMEADPNDWLQYRDEDWEAVAQDRWLALGERHLLGTVGKCVDVQLTIRDARPQSGSSVPRLAELVHFDFAAKVAPPDTVFLNVFDLASSVSIANSMLCNTLFSSFGAYHAAVEVYGEEWSFYRTPNPRSCGVCRSLRPRDHPIHVYRQSIPLGRTQLQEWQVRFLIRGQMSSAWPGGTYNLLDRNCIHFCDDLLLELGVSGVPSWVRALHETGSSLLRWPFARSALLKVEDEYTTAAEEEEEDDDDNARVKVTTRAQSVATTVSSRYQHDELTRFMGPDLQDGLAQPVAG